MSTLGKHWTITKGKKLSLKHCQNISKGLQGHVCSRETKLKISKAQEDNKYAWKGNDVGYYALHNWVRKEKGSASGYECALKDETCSLTIDWANIDGEYYRNLDDYIPLCHSHHKRYDIRKIPTL